MKLTKLFALLLALVMVLCACGTDPSTNPTQTPTTGTQGTEGKQEENKQLSLGKLENGVYTNEYAGIACNLSSAWSVYSAEELQELPDTVKDMLSGSELEEAVAGYETIIDMQAENVDDLLVMNLVYTKLKLSDRLRYATMSNEQIINHTLQQKDVLISTYQQVGIFVKSMEKKTVTYLGKEVCGIYTVAEVSGVPYYMLQVFDYHLGAYSYTITVSSYIDDHTQSILDMFYSLD